MWLWLLEKLPILRFWHLGVIAALILLIVGIFLYGRHIVSQNTELAQTVTDLKTDNVKLKIQQETIIKSQRLKDSNERKTKNLTPDAVITQLNDSNWLRPD